MSQHTAPSWKASALRFEREMLGIMSFGDSSMAEEIRSALDEAWGTAGADGHQMDLQFSTPQAALAYAREAHKITGDFLAAQERIAAQEDDSAPAQKSTKGAETPDADADSLAAPVRKKCNASDSRHFPLQKGEWQGAREPTTRDAVASMCAAARLDNLEPHCEKDDNKQ
jgi:hypothetical protein